MQRDYQSLLDHLGSGKAWDLSRRSGGLHLLPPFGANTRGDYAGTAEALNAVISYVRRHSGAGDRAHAGGRRVQSRPRRRHRAA